MRPVAHPRDQAMFERVDIAIFDMAHVISLVADQVLPETALPDAALVAREANGAAPLLLGQRLDEPGLDQSPACGKIAVARRQLPDRVQMIRQDDDCIDRCIDRKVMARARRRHRLAQAGDVIDEQGFPPLQQVDREEPASARNERATIIRHGAEDSR